MNDTFITVIGNVGTEISLAEVSGGYQVASFRVGSTPRRFANGEWQNQETNWFTVKAWRALATHVHQSMRQGDPVVVHGRLTAEVWQNAEGQTKVQQVLVATSVGHDLARGTATFVRASKQGSEPILEPTGAATAAPVPRPSPEAAAPLAVPAA